MAGQGGSTGLSVGDVLYLHDIYDTAFSKKPVMRWWVVIAVTGTRITLAPRSASSRGGIAVPASAKAEFTAEGNVQRVTRTIGVRRAALSRNIGQLPEPYRGQVLALFASPRETGRS